MTPHQKRRAKTLREQGFTAPKVADMLGVSTLEVRRATQKPRKKKRDGTREIHDAIKELLAEGHTLETIRKVFGQVV